MSKTHLSRHRPVMDNEARAQVERMIGGAARAARQCHPNMKLGELVSSVTKRFVPDLLNKYVLIDRTQPENQSDPDVLQDEIYRLNRNYDQLERDYERVRKKNSRSGRRTHQLLIALTAIAETGDASLAQQALETYKETADESED